MSISCRGHVVLCTLLASLHACYNLDYTTLEAVGKTCAPRDKCEGYRFNSNITERRCECDAECGAYGDCCIDYGQSRRRRTQRGEICLSTSNVDYTGVYAISKCSRSWNGLPEIREKCEGSTDYRDPVFAAPVTSTVQRRTFKNYYCAVCNDAPTNSLKLFNMNLYCDGLESLSKEQVYADIMYDEGRRSWGVQRLNDRNATVFHICKIIFQAPPYLQNSIRSCRANLISECHPEWTRNSVRRYCEQYMAVVFDSEYIYRNPHCALCNYKAVEDLMCEPPSFGRKRPMSFALLLDVNQSDGDQVGMTRVTTPQCATNEIYDPFFKKCKRLACAIPGRVVVNGRCVAS